MSVYLEFLSKGTNWEGMGSFLGLAGILVACFFMAYRADLL